MEKSYDSKLVMIIAGWFRGRENTKSMLFRVADLAGITPREAYAAFYEEYCSRITRKKLEAAARRKTENDYAEHIKWLRREVEALRQADPEMYRPHIDAAEHWIACLENYSSSPAFMAVPQGVFPGGEE